MGSGYIRNPGGGEWFVPLRAMAPKNFSCVTTISSSGGQDEGDFDPGGAGGAGGSSCGR